MRRYHRYYKGSGLVSQGRFKAFPIQDDQHYLTALRYVERNPTRAELVERSQNWRWSSLRATPFSAPEGLVFPGPVPKSANWTWQVNGLETEAELKSLDQYLARGTPFGDTEWQPASKSNCPGDILGFLRYWR